MPGYSHLTRSERDQIAELKAQGLGPTAIADAIGRHNSTVSRELRRNAHADGAFRTAKATLDTRPIFHSSDAAIRGHVFCSFLALVLTKELKDRRAAAGLKPE